MAKVDVYQMVTDRIITALEAGTPPWSKPWKNGAMAGLPFNMTSMDPEEGQTYTGINVPLLWASGYDDSRWITWNQAKKANITIKSDEAKNWTPIVFWNMFDKDNGDGTVQKIPFLRYYRVYNAEQCENPRLFWAAMVLKFCTDRIARGTKLTLISLGYRTQSSFTQRTTTGLLFCKRWFTVPATKAGSTAITLAKTKRPSLLRR